MDPIADLLSAIKNSMMARKQRVFVRYSKIKAEICQIFKDKSVIDDFRIVAEDNCKYIEVLIHDRAKVMHLRRISKPGKRVFVKSKDLKSPLSGLGFYIVSTPRGILTGLEAKKIGTGGEIICEVW